MSKWYGVLVWTPLNSGSVISHRDYDSINDPSKMRHGTLQDALRSFSNCSCRLAKHPRERIVNSMQTRCPKCSASVEIEASNDASSLKCSHCAQTFDLLDETTVVFAGNAKKSIGQFDLIQSVGSGAFGEEAKRARSSKDDSHDSRRYWLRACGRGGPP
jgi:DNA-directed RNA polymerase subunit RPC12/RpoP